MRNTSKVKHTTSHNGIQSAPFGKTGSMSTLINTVWYFILLFNKQICSDKLSLTCERYNVVLIQYYAPVGCVSFGLIPYKNNNK